MKIVKGKASNKGVIPEFPKFNPKTTKSKAGKVSNEKVINLLNKKNTPDEMDIAAKKIAKLNKKKK